MYFTYGVQCWDFVLYTYCTWPWSERFSTVQSLLLSFNTLKRSAHHTFRTLHVEKTQVFVLICLWFAWWINSTLAAGIKLNLYSFCRYGTYTKPKKKITSQIQFYSILFFDHSLSAAVLVVVCYVVLDVISSVKA